MNIKEKSDMTSDKQKKINKNNRKRGGAFEKRTADYLDMDVVPYSGSNARFGYGDVRDSIWLVECKNISPDENNRITLRHEWFDKNLERASAINHLSCIAWMPAGRVSKYIILDGDVVNKLEMRADTEVEIKKASVKSVNLIVELDAPYLRHLKSDCGLVRLKFGDELWYMLTIEFFKKTINERRMKGERSTI
jgi:hypothetical protein